MHHTAGGAAPFQRSQCTTNAVTVHHPGRRIQGWLLSGYPLRATIWSLWGVQLSCNQIYFHGISSAAGLRLTSSSARVRYLYWSRPFSFAVSMRLNSTALTLKGIWYLVTAHMLTVSALSAFCVGVVLKMHYFDSLLPKNWSSCHFSASTGNKHITGGRSMWNQIKESFREGEMFIENAKIQEVSEKDTTTLWIDQNQIMTTIGSVINNQHLGVLGWFAQL